MPPSAINPGAWRQLCVRRLPTSPLHRQLYSLPRTSRMSMSSTSDHPRVAIIGGGLGGLSLLLTLYKRGIPATVYERDTDRHSRARLGGNLDLEWTTGQRALRENGLEDAFRKNSRRDAEVIRICGKAGVPLLEHAGPDPNDQSLKDSRPEIDRTTLRSILLDAVPEDTIRWDHAFVSARALESGQYEVTFANGSVTVVDLLVGADGARSRVRPLVSDATPIYHGVTGVELSLMPEVATLPENRDIYDAVGPGTCFSTEDEKVFTFQRNHDGRIRAYAWHRAPLEWKLPDDPEEAKKALLGIFHDWAPWMRKFIELANDRSILPRPLFYLPVGHRWAHKPGVTLIGDAAHLMSPFGGSGANLAMVDGLELGLVLADVLKGGVDAGEREKAIAAFEESMCARAEEHSARTMKHLEFAMSRSAPQSMVEVFKKIVGEEEGTY
ncbi:monooxygenase FAD-binding protein [Trametes sanguinea]|nr:monooxygenase FAD-binding protein [Trametes sanguinea]